MKDLNLVKVKALRTFTKTTKHGQFHGDPNGVSKAKEPMVPDYVVDDLVASGCVKLSKSKAKAEDEGGEELTGDNAGDPLPPVEEGPYEAKHIGGGIYEITGPDDFSEKVKGKHEAAARVAELNASAEKTAEGDGVEKTAADTDAPTD